MKRIFLVLAGILLLLAACAPAKADLKDQLLGTWKNEEGYSIEFRSGGLGFIPGVPGKIPDSTFSYTLTDESHIRIDFQGDQQDVEIRIDGDQLVWKDDLGEVTYTRLVSMTPSP